MTATSYLLTASSHRAAAVAAAMNNNNSSRYVIQYGIAAYRYGGNMMSSCSSVKRTSPLGMIISFSRGGNHHHHHHNNHHQYTSFNHLKQQRVLLNMALFSTALYSTSISTPNTSFCSNNSSSNNNNDDEDFITKIKSKIDSSTLPTTLADLSNNPQLRTTLSTIQHSLQTIFDTGIPTQLSYGFIAGYLSGYTLKKIGRVASLTFGVGFVILQVMAYNGYIDVNHDRLRKEVEEMLDRNGDGIVDTEDLERVVEEVKKVVGFGLLDDDGEEESGDGKEEEGGEGGKKINAKAVAGGGGFGLGFLGGLRSG